MKRAFLLFCFIAINVNGFKAFPNKAIAKSEAIHTNAEAAALIDVATGVILYSKMGDKQMRIASLTKVMTAIVAIEQGDLAEAVTVSKRAAGREGSSIYLKLGEQMSLHDMLYGLMLRSGNDAATAIAEDVGGTEEGFAYLMNQKAEMLGMEHSSFMNPHGLDSKEHYSTANDMAQLSAYALRNPIFQEIVQTKLKKVPNPNETWNYIWTNKNKMLSLYPGANGVKTGYTKLALRCLISSATRNGHQLAVVTLNDSNDWADHSRLLDYGFKNFPLERLADKGEAMENNLKTAQSFDYPLTAEQKTNVTQRIELVEPNSVSYRLGTRGNLQFRLADKPIGSVLLVEGNNNVLEQNNSQAFSFQPTTKQVYMDNSSRWNHFLQALFRL